VVLLKDPDVNIKNRCKSYQEKGNMYSESELLPVSALQHLLFCKRQCALIHVEQLWEENRLTAEGRLMHEKVHKADDECRPGCKIARGLHIRLKLPFNSVLSISHTLPLFLIIDDKICLKKLTVSSLVR
jgi:hypothetical protein